MKRYFTILLTCLVLVGLFFMQGCSSSDAVTWNPLGIWNVNLIIPNWSHDWNDNFTFSGSETGGTVFGLTCATMCAQQTGNWSKTGDYSISMSFNFNWGSLSEIVNLSGTSSEANPNMITGSGTWNENGTTANMTFTATKI